MSSAFGGIPEQAVRRALDEEMWMSPEIALELETLAIRLRGWLSARLVDRLTAIQASWAGTSDPERALGQR